MSPCNQILSTHQWHHQEASVGKKRGKSAKELAPGHVNKHGRILQFIGEGINRLTLLGVQIAVAGDIAIDDISDISDHPEGEEEETKARVAHVQKGHGDNPHGITSPADGVGMKSGVSAEPRDLLRCSQQPNYGKALRAQHQQNRNRDLNQD